MSVQEVDSIDYLLKDGGLGMVEVRDPQESIWALKKAQVLMKGLIGIQFLRSDQVPVKHSTIYLFWVGAEPPAEMINFLVRHNFSVHTIDFNSGSNSSKVLSPNKIQNIQEATLEIDEKEISGLMKECANYFVLERKKDNILLDFSLESLKAVDQWLGANRDKFNENKEGKDSIVLAGAYLGEVMIRLYGGNWAFGQGLGMYAILVDIQGNKGNCIGRVSRLINDGAGNETYFFAKALASYMKEAKK